MHHFDIIIFADVHMALSSTGVNFKSHEIAKSSEGM